MFRGVPSLRPKSCGRVKLADAMKARNVRDALQQMAEEGRRAVFLPHDGASATRRRRRAAVDVLTERLNAEYALPVSFEQSSL